MAGATGVIGRQMTTSLTEHGHTVAALSRAPKNAATPEDSILTVRADALNAAELSTAVAEAAPEAVVNLLTAIPQQVDSRRVDREFTLTNRLRTLGTRNLIEASRAADVRHHVAASLAYGYRPGSAGELKTEESPWWTDGPAWFRPVVEALRELEERTLTEDGTVLRFGHLYGHGSAFAADGNFATQVRKRMLPVVGGGNAVFSFIHAGDAAAAVVAALEGPRGTVGGRPYNIVDDDPTPVSFWLPEYARMLGAKPPRRVPAWALRPVIGRYGVAFMNELAGADNSLVREQLSWSPQHSSWRDGFAAELTTGFSG
nr:NAD(P)-dependent oxidoreductase [Brachybacterium sp. P6-10-X1]